MNLNIYLSSLIAQYQGRVFVAIAVLLMLSACTNTYSPTKVRELNSVYQQQIALSTEDIFVNEQGKQRYVGTKTGLYDLFSVNDTTHLSDIYRHYLQGRSALMHEKNTFILVIGHTDNTGSALQNVKIAKLRAETVAKALITSREDTDTVYYLGVGEYFPVAKNSTAQGRAKNRRVELLEFSNLGDLQTFAKNYHLRFKQLEDKERKEEAQKKAAEHQKKLKQDQKRSHYVEYGGEPYQMSKVKLVEHLGEVETHMTWPLSLIHLNSDESLPMETCIEEDKPTEPIMPKQLPTRDYLPGMNQRAWWGMIGQNALLISPVAVQKEDNQPVAIPIVSVYRHYKKAAPAYVKYTAKLKVYTSADKMLLRLFNDDSGASLRCIDLLIPQHLGAHPKAIEGKLFYNDSRGIKMVDFLPQIP